MPGPLPRRVYIRRRLIVLGGLLAVVAAIVLVMVLPGRSSSPAVDPVELPDDLQSAAAATDDADGDAPPACASARVAVTPLLDQTEYAAGELPEVALSVVNTAEAECVLDLGTAEISFEVTSGSQSVWRSVDCQTDADSRPIILVPGEPLETEPVPWDRTFSDPETCDITRDSVTAGGASYHLRATVGDVRSAETVQFLLF